MSKKPPAQTPILVPNRSSSPSSLKEVAGSRSHDFNTIAIDQAIKTVRAFSTDAGLNQQYQAVIATMMGIAPRDELEGMMAAQLVGLHNAAMECMRRAMIPEQTFEGRRENLNQANKLTRSYATLLEALDRRRGRGTPQKIVVERVTVQQGGQAVVGVVEAEGGASSTSEDQPHAKHLAHAPQSALWSQDPQRQPMSLARNAKR